MTQVIDARGFSCPQPVLLAVNAMDKTGNGELEVLVDNEASRENVDRAARRKGWTVAASDEPDGNFRLVLQK
ncbi:TusA-related sulfurtransferase [Desulfonatronum thiosulfatophilum]|uniref:TusA-related sulfurtransferase n=1 Tax=Desulfonatronum thiosulfatophilum TaxID=617002 RepID=A0A1G6EV01_9BACT|nr:sulfurtransferase TusA family protein [Desulfonatronum thiosulfatophilum]SDB61233.1 TusA-related sulfurtransferase [Desulfonatronum thiosulfatophilum]